ncbi:hypothetical protein B0H13DRAFT_1952291 [Mycena leptocephala]|nr:hypothetical protein B0H13DRAFT_1952291 [Mycena leptocephala]
MFFNLAIISTTSALLGSTFATAQASSSNSSPAAAASSAATDIGICSAECSISALSSVTSCGILVIPAPSFQPKLRLSTLASISTPTVSRPVRAALAFKTPRKIS